MFHGLNQSADTPSVLQRLFMGRTKGLQDDGAGMDVRVSPPKGRDSRFERSMAEALRQENEKLEMQEVLAPLNTIIQCIRIPHMQCYVCNLWKRGNVVQLPLKPVEQDSK